jgi:putative NADH-flavin reductase
MRLTIIAATGGIGRQLVGQAVAGGHEVTAVARNPRDLPTGIRVVRADLSADATDALKDAVDGADAVLSGLGPRVKTDAGVAARGTRSIVDAMHATDARRLLVVSAAPIGTVVSPGRPNPPKHDPGDGFVMRHVMNPLIRRILREHYADLAVMEDVVRDSGLQWTIIRPPQLTDTPWTGKYRTAYGQNLRRGLKVSRADVADLMLALVAQPESIGPVVGVAY